MMTDLHQSLLNILKGRKGVKHHANNLALKLGIPDKSSYKTNARMRMLARDLNMMGHPIVATTAAGFWYTESSLEVAAYIRSLHSRAESIYERAGALWRIFDEMSGGPLDPELMFGDDPWTEENF